MAGERWPLPEGWGWTTVDDLWDVVGGGTPSTEVDDYWTGTLPWITSADIHGLQDIRPRRHITERAVQESATSLVPTGTLIVVTRVALGKVALARFPLCFSQDSQGLVRGNGRVFPEYALYYLSQAVQSFKHSSRGTTIAGVTKKQLRELPFPLAPLAEQRRIVAKIEELFSELDSGVAALKRVQANLKRYRASVLKAACEGRLVPTEAELAREEGRDYEPADVLLKRILAERRARWEAEHPGKKYVDPVAPETNGLPELPDGWCWVALPQIGDLARGKSKHRPRNDPRLYGGPYPFVQTGDVKQADGTITTYSQSYNEVGLAQSRLWPKGTLCITIAANIAETAVLGFNACFPDSVVGFIGTKEACNVRFVEYFIRTAKDDLERYAPATAQKNINLDTLEKLAIAFPPLPEQHRIVAEVERRLSVAGESEATVAANLARASRLRQAVLKRAFEGKLWSNL